MNVGHVLSFKQSLSDLYLFIFYHSTCSYVQIFVFCDEFSTKSFKKSLDQNMGGGKLYVIRLIKIKWACFRMFSAHVKLKVIKNLIMVRGKIDFTKIKLKNSKWILCVGVRPNMKYVDYISDPVLCKSVEGVLRCREPFLREIWSRSLFYHHKLWCSRNVTKTKNCLVKTDLI